MTMPHLPCTVEISDRQGVWAAASTHDDDVLLSPFYIPVPPLETDRPVQPRDFVETWVHRAVEHRDRQESHGVLSWLKRLSDPQVVLSSRSGSQVFTRLVFDGRYLRRRCVVARLEPRWADVIDIDDATRRVEMDNCLTRFEFPENDPPLAVLGGALKLYRCVGDQWLYQIDRVKPEVLLIDVDDGKELGSAMD